MIESNLRQSPPGASKSRARSGSLRPDPAAQVQALLDLLPTGAYACDVKGIITACNRRAIEEFWGQPPGLASKTSQRFCGAFQRLSSQGGLAPRNHSCIAQILRGEAETAREEVIFQWENGKRVHALLSASPLRDSSGKLTGAIGVLTNIDPLQAARDELESKLQESRRAEMLVHEANDKAQMLIMNLLHEDIGQRFTGIALIAGVLQKSLAKESHPMAKKAQDVAHLVGECIALVSDLARRVYPPAIHSEGLMPAIHSLALRIESRFNIPCRVIREPACQLPKRDALHVYRILELSILAAIKHHGAKAIQVEFKSVPKSATQITIEYAWKKSGPATPAKVSRETDLLQSRARLLGATLQFEVGPKRVVRLRIPKQARSSESPRRRVRTGS